MDGHDVRFGQVVTETTSQPPPKGDWTDHARKPVGRRRMHQRTRAAVRNDTYRRNSIVWTSCFAAQMACCRRPRGGAAMRTAAFCAMGACKVKPRARTLDAGPYSTCHYFALLVRRRADFPPRTCPSFDWQQHRK